MDHEKSFAFIIGAPRSGTTWVQRMLGDHPQVCTSGELKLYSSYIAPWLQTWEGQVKLQGYGDYSGLPTVWTQEEFHAFIQDFIGRVYERVIEAKPKATIVLDKTPWYSDFVEIIDQFHPAAKFIHVIRDGRDVATSLLAASQGWGEIWAPKSVESAASKWKRQVLAAKRARKYGDRYMEVRYEDLLQDGEQVLASLFQFLAVPVIPEEVSTIFDENRFDKMAEKKIGTSGVGYPKGFFRKGRAGDWKSSLLPIQKYVFHKNAGDLLLQLGYADSTWWAENRYDRYTLPLASLFSKQHLSRAKKYFGRKMRAPS